jgi:hypothetical protein
VTLQADQLAILKETTFKGFQPEPNYYAIATEYDNIEK